MTELDALNILLEAVGDSGLASYTPGADSTADRAYRVLQRVNRQVQSKGWSCNTKYRQAFTPAAMTGIITLTNILSATPTYTSAELLATIRDGKLYDPVNATFDWSDHAAIYLETVELIAFTQLPDKLAMYIARKAAVEWHRVTMPESTEDSFLRAQELEAKIEADREHNAERSPNIFATDEAAMVLGNRFPFGPTPSRGPHRY